MKILHEITTEFLNEGVEYSVGTSDGKVFNKLVYKGSKNFGGKNMMCFETEHKSQVTINPSYNSFTIEEQGQFPMPEDLGNQQNKGDSNNG
tara:strand:+ start:2568 stop:2840 length:273 start_codon:yes stop_codon:yes gene_type:complete